MAATAEIRRVFIRNLLLLARVGVHAHERGRTQRVRVSVELDTPDEPRRPSRLAEVVDYEALAEAIRGVVAAGHVVLVEELADRIASVCLRDGRVAVARVRVEKLDVFADAECAGVEVERRREVIPAARESEACQPDGRAC